MPTIILPEGYSYVAAGIMSSVFLVAGQIIVATRARKRAGIPYPQVYAEQAEVKASREAMVFNCAQRAHMNTLEWIPLMWSMAVLAGVHHPKYAGGTLGLWVFSRIIYTHGYATGDPKKRGRFGFLGGLSEVGLLLGSVYSVGLMIASEL